jgi:hypothetical protein
MIARISLVVALAVVGACFEHHDPMNQPIANEDCYTCHTPEYRATGTATFPLSPPHQTSGCSTQCAQCHTTSEWVTGLGGCAHPEDKFPLASQGTQHTNIKCIDCHSSAISLATGATSVSGANTDCIACHPNSSAMANNHVGVVYDAGTLIGQPYAYSNTDHRFCLDCHPKGLAAGHGPMNPFTLPHHGASCAQCHDNASGLGHANGKDVTCVGGGCHRTHNDPPSGTGIHVGTTSPSCIMGGCHPNGRGGG